MLARDRHLPVESIPEHRSDSRSSGSASGAQQATAPVIAVSPIIGGQAVKGPTAKIMAELGTPVSNVSIAAHYHGLIDGLVVDAADASRAGAIDVPVHATCTLMQRPGRPRPPWPRGVAFADTFATCSTRVLSRNALGRPDRMTGRDDLGASCWSRRSDSRSNGWQRCW